MATMNARPRRLRRVRRAMVAVLLLGGALSAFTATSPNLPIADAQPPAGIDVRGFVNSAARCDPQQTAVMVGRTKLSLIAICTSGGDRFEYRGVRLSDQAMQRLPAMKLANGCFGARTDQIYYTVSERKLLLTSGARVVRDEPMLEFKDYRAAAVAPMSEQITHVG